MYINGQLQAVDSLSASSFSMGSANHPLIFGGVFDANGANVLGRFSGYLDDIAIWNRALSQQEITQLYNQVVTPTLQVIKEKSFKVWPNPANGKITLDAGNLSSMQGWKYKVANTLGQTVVNETAFSQQQTLINLSTWGGNGIYYLHLINPQGHAIEIKKIVLAP